MTCFMSIQGEIHLDHLRRVFVTKKERLVRKEHCNGWYNRSEEKIDGKRKANRRKKN